MGFRIMGALRGRFVERYGDDGSSRATCIMGGVVGRVGRESLTSL